MFSELALLGKGMSLDRFFKDHAHTVAVMGVLGGLAVLLQSIEIPFFRNTLSGICIVGMMLAWWELIAIVPKEASLRLFLFQYVWLAGGVTLGIFSLYQYRIASSWILFAVTFLFVLVSIIGLLVSIFKHFGGARRFFGLGIRKPKWWQTAALFGLCLGIMFAALIVAIIVVFGANVVVEIAYRLLRRAN